MAKKIRDLNPSQYYSNYDRDNDDKRPYNEALEFQNLLMNAVKLVDENGTCDFILDTYVKRLLFGGGAVGYDKIANRFARVFGQGIDEYGNPTELTFYSNNGRTWTRPASYDNKMNGAYYLKALPISFPLFSVIDKSVEFLNLCDVAIKQNIEAVKTPYIVAVRDEDTRLSLEQAILQKQSGQAAIVVNTDIAEGLKGISINTNYVGDKLNELRTKERDKLLNKLGVLTANIDKKERIQVGEVNATIGECSDYINLVIDTFNKQCDTYDIPYKLEINNALEYYLNDTNIEEQTEVTAEDD